MTLQEHIISVHSTEFALPAQTLSVFKDFNLSHSAHLLSLKFWITYFMTEGFLQPLTKMSHLIQKLNPPDTYK
jgi:hypothetical protein